MSRTPKKYFITTKGMIKVALLAIQAGNPENAIEPLKDALESYDSDEFKREALQYCLYHGLIDRIEK